MSTRAARPRSGGEPIRLVFIKGNVPRYRVTLDVGSPGRRKQKTTTHPTLKAARAYMNATKADLARGTYMHRTGRRSPATQRPGWSAQAARCDL